MSASDKTELLLAHDDEIEPVLSQPPETSSAAGQAEKVSVRAEECLADISASANDLAAQRWAVVVPKGREGERLRELVAPLIARRAEEQKAEVLVIDVEPGMDPIQAELWKETVYPGFYDYRETRRPRYLFILGDHDQVSLATQQQLASDGFPGRLVCNDDRGYQAYAEKVLRWEDHLWDVAGNLDRKRPRTLFFSVHDGTPATSSGYHKLIQPCLHETRRLHGLDEFPASSIEDCGDPSKPNPDELLDLGSRDDPTVLMSMSHGLGPPRRRRWTPDDARQRQGAMTFGNAGTILPSEIATRPFFPGGLWFYFACFGAGTPSRSAYEHWLRMLKEQGMEGIGRISTVLAGLDELGGFTSGIARSALANPLGPLAILGHVDLAWSYSYEKVKADDDQTLRTINQSEHYLGLLTRFVNGERVGVSYLDLQRNLAAVGAELNRRYDRCRQRGVDPEGASPAEKITLGNLWMRRQDLLGYVILGDPAARLPLATRQPEPRRARESDRAATARPERRSRAASVPNIGRRRSRAASVPNIGRSGARPTSEKPRTVGVAGLEEAVLAVAVGRRAASDVAAEIGREASQLESCKDAYLRAGRGTIIERLAETADDQRRQRRRNAMLGMSRRSRPRTESGPADDGRIEAIEAALLRALAAGRIDAEIATLRDLGLGRDQARDLLASYRAAGREALTAMLPGED